MIPHPDFFSGFQAAAYLVCTVFFLRFWMRAREGLFLAFAFAFLLLSLQQFLIVFLGLTEEDRGWVYVLRLVAFSAIIIAIVRKNVAR